MDVENKTFEYLAGGVGLLSLLIAHIWQVFKTGKEQGRLESKITEHDDALTAHGERIDHYATRIETMQTEFDDKLNTWFHKIDGRIGSIESQFITSNGEQRFVSHQQHEVMQQSCQLHVLSEIGHVNTSIKDVRKDVHTLTEEIKGLTKSVAFLSAKE